MRPVQPPSTQNVWTFHLCPKTIGFALRAAALVAVAPFSMKPHLTPSPSTSPPQNYSNKRSQSHLHHPQQTRICCYFYYCTEKAPGSITFKQGFYTSETILHHPRCHSSTTTNSKKCWFFSAVVVGGRPRL